MGDFWRDYKNDPEIKESKRLQKLENAGQREIERGEKKIRDAEQSLKEGQRLVEEGRRKLQSARYQQLEHCDDWLLHNGYMHFARNRELFSTYTRIDTTVTLFEASEGQSKEFDNTELQVLGIGTVEVQVKGQLGQRSSHTHTFTDVLHVPAARCNGVSKWRMLSNGFVMNQHYLNKSKTLWTFSFTRTSDNRVACCGSNTSGRDRILMAGEKEPATEPIHPTSGLPISIRSNETRIRQLRTEAERKAQPQARPVNPPTIGPNGKLLRPLTQQPSVPSEQRQGWDCDGCGTPYGQPPRYGGARWRCTLCPPVPGYDLCGDCYEEHQHLQGLIQHPHPPIEFDDWSSKPFQVGHVYGVIMRGRRKCAAVAQDQLLGVGITWCSVDILLDTPRAFHATA